MNLCIDTGQITQVERTKEGAIRVWATVSRTGDLEYRTPSGSAFVQRITADQLFSADSLNTAWGKPITVGHPLTEDGRAIAVTPENMARYRVGTTGQSMRQVSDQFLSIVAVIDDERGIEAIENGAREISAGYWRDPVVVDGVIHQHNRRYNHFAIVPKGRAGDRVRLHIDAETTIQIDQPEQPTPKPMKTITIDGVGYQVEQSELATAIASLQKEANAAAKEITKLKTDAGMTTDAIDKLSAERDKLNADAAELRAQLDAVTGERDALKGAQLTEDAIATAALERVQTAEQVRTLIADAEINYAATPEQMRREAVAAKGMSVDGKSDEYVAGVFSALVANAPNEQRANAIAKTAKSAPTVDGADVPSLDELRRRLDSETANAWRAK